MIKKISSSFFYLVYLSLLFLLSLLLLLIFFPSLHSFFCSSFSFVLLQSHIFDPFLPFSFTLYSWVFFSPYLLYFLSSSFSFVFYPFSFLSFSFPFIFYPLCLSFSLSKTQNSFHSTIFFFLSFCLYFFAIIINTITRSLFIITFFLKLMTLFLFFPFAYLFHHHHHHHHHLEILDFSRYIFSLEFSLYFLQCYSFHYYFRIFLSSFPNFCWTSFSRLEIS